VEDFYALLDPVPVSGPDLVGTSQIWAERLKVCSPADTRVLAWFGPNNGWLDGQPAITERDYGKGRVTFIGACLDECSQQSLLERITVAAGVTPVLVTPSGVEAARRIGPNAREIFILINHAQEEKRVILPWPAREHLRNQLAGKEIILPPYEVALLTRI